MAVAAEEVPFRARLLRLRPLSIPAATAVLLVFAWWVERLAGVMPAGAAGEAGAFAAPWVTTPWPALALYAAACLVGGWESARRGLASLRRGRIDIDFLMVAAAAGAFAIGQPQDGAVLIFIFALGNALEHYALAHTRRAIQALVRLRPTRARRLRSPGDDGAAIASMDGALQPDQLETVGIEALRVGDIVQVLPGERLPVDGVVVHGRSALDTSAITGESIPQEKGPGDMVLAGSVNQQGLLWVRVSRPAEDSTLARIIQLVEQAQEHKAPTQLFIERFEQVYSAAVVGLTLLMMVVPPLALGWDLRTSLYRAMTVMVVASPCAVVLSTMPAMLSAVASGARKGVLFKGALYLEQLAHVRVVALDKTGTLTVGRPEVAEVVAAEGWTPEQVLAVAAGVEAGSEHPIAKAVVEQARRRGLTVAVARETQVLPGRGVQGYVGEDRVRVGSPTWFAREGFALPASLAQALRRMEAAGQTVMLVGVNGSGPIGAISVADRLRPQARLAVEGLKRRGIRRVVMLTGDNPAVAAAVAAAAGVDEYHAGLLPEQKLAILQRLTEQYGPVAMVGDGINDAPALAAASVGIAMGRAGTDVALETADVVLMSDDLSKLEGSIALGRRAEQVVRQNLAFAFGVIGVLLVLAVSGHLSLTQGVVGHEGSTVLVALNGLRLLGFRWPSASVEGAVAQRPLAGATELAGKARAAGKVG